MWKIPLPVSPPFGQVKHGTTLGNTRSKLGFAIVICGAGVLLFCLALVIRAYMPCPYWDEWVVIRDIALGKGPRDLGWLWSLQNEHRPVIPRLLILADVHLFGGRNISLFAESGFCQVLNLTAICWVIERYTDYPVFLKRSLQGIFAFALFHPNQQENFTWAFQVQFLIAFAVATFALIVIAFFRCWRYPGVTIGLAGFAPLVAAMSLASGLLIGPVIIVLSAAKRLPLRYFAWLSAAFALSAIAYLHGYRRVGTDLGGAAVLSHMKEVLVYVLTYFGASWTKILPHKERLIAFLGLITYVVLLIRRLKSRKTTDLEWFLLAECTLTLVTGFLTAFGRIQFGAGQAFASRYQTPAMIFWAGLGGLMLIRLYDRWPERFAYPQAGTLFVMLVSMATFPTAWGAASGRASVLRSACQGVMGANPDLQDARKLYELPGVVTQARPFLRGVWQR